MQFYIKPGGVLTGNTVVPGDKSISHRAVILSAIADGTSTIDGLLAGEDVLATIAAFRALGVEIEGPENNRLVVKGVGMQGLVKPTSELDMGNSGTAMRLLSGVLAGQDFRSVLKGDASLSRRPMKRVTVPLSSMGADIDINDDGTPPITIEPTTRLNAISYTLPVASAQVKSAILLAGLYAQGQTCVTETEPTRDHTERMLLGMGYEVKRNDQGTICLSGGGQLAATAIQVPGDISSAAFFLVAASIARGSDLLLEHIGVNPTRTGILDILKLMGANIHIKNKRMVTGEPVADIEILASKLTAIDVPEELIPSAIDEFPVICIAAACAQGVTRIRGAEELRHKESDRIAAMVAGLSTLGITVTEHPDGLDIQGGELKGGVVNSYDDHRIAMSFAISGLVANAEIRIENCDNVATSFPEFQRLSKSLGLGIKVI